jgi:hypothetical protein
MTTGNAGAVLKVKPVPLTLACDTVMAFVVDGLEITNVTFLLLPSATAPKFSGLGEAVMSVGVFCPPAPAFFVGAMLQPTSIVVARNTAPKT